MSFEILDQLEAKIKQAVETIELLQLELEEKNERINQLDAEKNNVCQERDTLRNENEQLRNEHNNWQERLRSLLGKIDNV
ncbi:cell division protein ZapB [Cricetibacter osteomyelitidis]|uniref:Cell division protein ZapB n=1 Tax=Cricetibacter osteomyelitidis TaxID=1521931 RepID=A0A4R2T322_9PAST|nr:cell division protein ZapB [Cricetibacter osteomyelitidis]TCP97329.1 cell division protein ZapB [Cricetibacter osteomyelitidis]